MSIPQMPLPILLPRESLPHLPVRARIFATLNVTEVKFRSLMNVVMMSLDIFRCLEAPAADLTLVGMGVGFFVAVIVAGEGECSFAVGEFARHQRGTF